MKRFAIVVLLLLVVGGCMRPATPPPNDVLHDITWAHGLFDLYRHERLLFTFHAKLPDKIVQRRWVWHIQTDRVFLDGVEQAASSQAFVNDIHWLLFPLKAYESRDQIEVAVNRHQKAPLTGMDSTEVVVRYVSGKGYTPNDVYKLYVDENMIVREWGYLRGGQAPPARATTWRDYRLVGRMELALLREGREGFKVWFTDVRVE